MKTVARGALLCLLWAVAGSVEAAPRTDLVVERAVLVMRHGIRAPLAGEVPDGTRTDTAWPDWPVTESRITAHGARALEIVAAADRRLLAARGLLMATGCPPPRTVRIHSNSSSRTIASGEAYATGFAPGCALAIEHRPLGEADPIFEPLRARATAFDAGQAVAVIERETGGMARLVAQHRQALAELDAVLGCAPAGAGCVVAGAAGLAASADGHDLVLTGPIRAASGIAQVLLLEYVEGMPLAQVGWGRVNAAGLQRLGALHAALFAVFTKPSYMAAHQSAVLGRAVLQALNTSGPERLQILMGHDTNVTALAATLGIDLDAPGYATNDVPPGGALLLERVRERRSGAISVRVSYRTQSPDALRNLSSTISLQPRKVLDCVVMLCPMDRFGKRLRARLADTIGQAGDQSPPPPVSGRNGAASPR